MHAQFCRDVRDLYRAFFAEKFWDDEGSFIKVLGDQILKLNRLTRCFKEMATRHEFQ